MALISACSAWGTGELVKGLLEIVEKGLPLGRSDHQMLVRFLHGTAGVLLRPTSSPADHFSNEVLEARMGNTMMGLGYPCVRIQVRIDHDSIDEVIHRGGNAVDAAEPLVKAGPRFRDRAALELSLAIWMQYSSNLKYSIALARYCSAVNIGELCCERNSLCLEILRLAYCR